MRSSSAILPVFHNLGLRSKLGILMAVLGLPIVVLLVLQYQQANKDIAFATSESDGLTYVGEGPMQLLYDVQRHRLLQAAALHGDSTYRAALQESAAAIENDLQRIATLQARFNDWDTESLVQATVAKWDELKKTSESNPDAVLVAHNTLVEQAIIPLIFQIANHSNLYLDPEINTLNTLIGVLSDLVDASEAGSRSAAHAVSVGRSGLLQSDLNRELAPGQIQSAQTARTSMLRWIDAAMESDITFRNAINDLVQTSNVEAERLSTRSAAALDTIPGRTSIGEIVDIAGSSIDSNEALFVGAAAAVSKELATRTGDARTSQVLLLGFSAFAFVVAIAVALAVATSITRPIERLAYVADQMSLGQLDVEIDIESKNEIGQLAESLRRMQASLKGAIERLRARKAA